MSDYDHTPSDRPPAQIYRYRMFVGVAPDAERTLRVDFEHRIQMAVAIPAAMCKRTMDVRTSDAADGFGVE